MVGESERMQRFAFALQQAMTARKLSARQVAMAIEVDARHVAKWLKGRGLPNLYQADELVRVLRVREDLFRDPPPVPVQPAYPISDYLIGAAEGAVAGALEEGRLRGEDRARRPLEAEAPSERQPSDGQPLPSESQ